MPLLHRWSVRRSGLLFLALVVWNAALAQSIRWEPAGGSLSLSRTSEIQLVFENCEPTEEVKLPSVVGLELQPAGQAENTSIMNGRITKLLILSFAVRPLVEKTLQIPSFTLKTDRGPLPVPAATFQVTPAMAGSGRIPLDQISRGQFELPAEVWAGEVFPLAYRLTTLRRYFNQFGSHLTWDHSPLVIEDWPKHQVKELLQQGEKSVVYSLETRGLAADPGELTLKTGQQLVNLVTGSSTLGFFATPNIEQFTISTPPPVLRVKALPAGAPATFGGAVGSFTLESKVVPAQAKVGEPVTWTLTLQGEGNWPRVTTLPAREVSRSFRAVQAEPKRTLSPNQLFNGELSEDVVLIPQEPGTYRFGPYRYTYFDPRSGRYLDLETPEHRVVITAAAAPSPTGGAGAGNFLHDTKAPPAPGLPAPVPGAALTTTVTARAPWSLAEWCLALGAPVLVGLLGWTFLAVGRARRDDPQAGLRRARAAAAATLRELASLPDHDDPAAAAARRRLVARWQQEMAAEAGLERAYPRTSPGSEPEGVRLWAEAETFLFGPAGHLPGDWVSRAQAALAQRPTHAFRLNLLWRRAVWWPALLAVACLMPHSPLAADPGLEAYRRGDYLAAEAAWRGVLERDPLAVGTRYHLSLALAQQELWAEATAQATVAWVQAPDRPELTRHLRYLQSKPGFTAQLLPELLADTPTASLVRAASPAHWQRAAVLAVALVVLAAMLGLLRLYRLGPSQLPWAAWLLLGLGVVGGLVSLYGFLHYGLLRDGRAALVWRETGLYSLPTAVEQEQQKSVVAPGTVVVQGRRFLTWVEVRFANDQTGWVQAADLEPVWARRVNE